MAVWTTRVAGGVIEASHINDLQAGKIDSDGTATPTLAKLTIYNNADADFIGSLKLRSGITADYRNYIQWTLYNGSTTSWLMGKNATNDFILYNSVNNHHYMFCYDSYDGSMRISSRGTAQVMVNGHADSPSSGGMAIYNGGAVPAKIIDFTPAAATFVTVQGTAVSTSQIALKVNTVHSAAVSGSATVAFKSASIEPTLSSALNTTGTVDFRGLQIAPIMSSAITACGAASAFVGANIYAQVTGTGTLPAVMGLNINGPQINNAGVTVTASYGIYIGNPAVSAGTLSNAYGLYIADITTGAVNFGLYSAASRNAISGNLSIGSTSFGASATREIIMRTGTAPSGNVTDCFQMYSDDQVAGNAAPHFRTENGSIVKLYKYVDSDLDYVAPSGATELELAVEALVAGFTAMGLIASA